MPILLSDIGRDQHGPTSTPAVLSDPLKILNVDDEQQVPLLVDHASSSSSTVPIDIMSILKDSLHLIYDFAQLRQIVTKEEDEARRSYRNTTCFFRRGGHSKRRLHKRNVSTRTVGLEDDKQEADDDLPDLLVNNKEPITAAAMLNFLHNKNRDYTRDRTGNHKQGNITSKSLASMEVRLTKLPPGAHNGEIVEFEDGMFSAYEELLYSIVVNRKEKRIVVVFRASGPDIVDWIEDDNMINIIDDPDLFEEDFFERVQDITWQHSDYLFGSNKEGTSKFDQILNTLARLYSFEGNGTTGNGYIDHELFVIGHHSLGKCLANLLAFALTTSPKSLFIPKPVTAITFGAPAPSYNRTLDLLLQREGFDS